jgi:putative transposase
MPRANRYFSAWLRPAHYTPLPSEEISADVRSRSSLLPAWVFEAKKRYSLCVLDYIVTSNHVHLLIKDTGSDVIAESMQLSAGRTAHEYVLRRA